MAKSRLILLRCKNLSSQVCDRWMRAVGQTNGRNRITILIPCHRVVNRNGDLGGYGGGLRRKQYLLNLEQGAALKNLKY